MIHFRYVDTCVSVMSPVITHIPEEISAFPAMNKKELAKHPKNTHYISKNNMRTYFYICCHLSSASVSLEL